jgi:hypothetical protein
MGLAVNVARHRERSLPTARFGRGSATTRTPRPMCSRVTTTGGRSPGSRVTASHRLPRHTCPVANGERLAAYSCGGSRGIGTMFEELALTAFPFDPRGEPSP